MAILPFEVLRIIFAHLSKKDLYTCMVLCKSFYSDISPVFYKEIVWKPSFTGDHIRCLNSVTRVDGTRICDFVKKIQFLQHKSSWKMSKYQFASIIDALPHLQVVHTCGAYMEYLKNVPVAKLAKVQEISLIPSSHNYGESIEAHLLTNLRVKNQLTTINLTIVPAETLLEYNSRMLAILSGLAHLKYLTMECDTQGTDPHRLHRLNRDIKLISMASILNHCPNLVSLDLTTPYRWTLSNNNVVHRNLVSLYLSVEVLTEKHAQYIIQHVPNLESFGAKLDGYYFAQVFKRYDPNIIRDFTTYLRKLKYLDIKMVILPRVQLPSLLAFIDAFWYFFCELCGDDYGRLKIRGLPMAEPTITTQITKRNQGFDIDIGVLFDHQNKIDWEQALGSMTFKKMHVESHHGTDVQPFIHLLKKQQEMQCSLYFSAASQKISFRHGSSFTRDGVPPKIGEIYGFSLTESLLEDIGYLYPFTQLLEIKHCHLEKQVNNGSTNQIVYKVNLSHFPNLRRVTFDLGSIKDVKNHTKHFYLQLYNTTTHSNTYLYYSGKHDRFIKNKDEKMKKRRRCVIVKIDHVQIQKFVIRGS